MPASLPDLAHVLGLTPSDVEWYKRLRPHSGTALAELAPLLDVETDDLWKALEPLEAAGVVETSGRVLIVPAPTGLVASMVGEEVDLLRGAVDRLERLRTSLPAIRGMFGEPAVGPALADAELRAGHDVHATLRAWVTESRGDLMWLRPDQWQLPQEPEMTRTVQAALARGQRSRAIYPARVLEQAPASLFHRMEAGEEVRLVAEVPSRLAVVSGVGAILPEEWGVANQRRIVLRHAGMVGVLAELFEELWARAVVVPGAGRPVHDRRLLLHQMARGAKDEQIARALGMSLRTVRRRVADLLLELGVETRFQAGVEAVRRGWI